MKGSLKTYQELIKHYKDAVQVAQRCVDTFGLNGETTKTAITKAKILDAQIKSFEATIPRYTGKCRIGNYNSKLKG